MPSKLNLASTQVKERRAEPLDQMAAPLLRPHQLEAMTAQVKGLERSIRATAAGAKFGGTASVADTRRALGRIKRQVEDQAPRQYEPGEVDDAIAAEATLREEIQAGMPTGEEMRKNPPGAVSKHRRWERQNKPKILAWKNIRLRLHASGRLPESGDVEARDVSNVELLRQHHNGGQLSMDNAQIAGKQFFLPTNIDPKNLMSEQERAQVQAETAVLVQNFAAMKAEQRAKVLARVMGTER